MPGCQLWERKSEVPWRWVTSIRTLKATSKTILTWKVKPYGIPLIHELICLLEASGIVPAGILLRDYGWGFPVIPGRQQSHSRFLGSLALTILLPLFWDVPWALDVRVVLQMCPDVLLGSPRSLVLYIVTSYGFLQWSLLQREVSVKGESDASFGCKGI